PVFIFIIPGMIALALAKTGRAPGLAMMVGADGRAIPSVAQAAFPLMVTTVMPAGIRGMVVAGLLAALMSSLAGAFNASSTLFTIDFYQRLKPQSNQHELVRVGRLATVAMVLISLLWIPVIQGSKGLYDYLQGVQGYLAPPIFAVFFLGVTFKRLNAKGCLAALIVGFLLGAFRLAVDTPVSLGMAGFAQGYPTGSFLDREQRLLSVLQPVHFRRLVSHDDRRELCDDRARDGAGHEPDVRHGDGGEPRKVARQLEPVGRDQLRRRARPDPARVSVLHGVRRRTMTLSRRSALKLGLGAGALEVLGRPVLLGAEPVATARVLDTAVVKARPLPLSAVRLTGGPLKHAQELSARYLLQLEPDRMLAYYRKRAGLEPKAEPYGGWDGDGRNLTGHIAGHHLSGVSLMWAATGDVRFKERA